LRPAPEPLEDRTLLAFDLPAGFNDFSFNGFGLQTTHVGRSDTVGAGALQPDGKIVVAGSVDEGGGSQTIALVRYLTNGHPDSGFGPAGAGFVELSAGSTIHQVDAIVVDENQGSSYEGDIVVAGSWTDAANQDELALARFKPDGSLDTGFGAAGIVLDSSEPNSTGLALSIQPDDKIVVLGASNWPSSSAIPFVERFNPDGMPDSSFGSGSQPVLPFGNVPVALNGGLALDAGGHIVVAGIENASSSSATIVVAGLESDGQPALRFGPAGIATTPVQGDQLPINVAGLAVNPSGRIVVAGTAGFYNSSTSSGSPTATSFWVARFDVSGELDPTFNGGSLKFVDLQQNGFFQSSAASGIALAPDGKVVLAGNTSSTSSSDEQEDIALARLNADGTLDESFGEGGETVPYIGPSVNAILPSLLVQPDGNIVTAFTYEIPNGVLTTSDFGVARYLGQDKSTGSGTIAAGNYRESFVSASNPTNPTLDSSDVFEHTLWYNLQPSLDRIDVAKGNGWDLERHPAGGNFALHEGESYTGAVSLDAITFPDLRPDVRVALASVDVAAVDTALVTFVGANGSYTVKVPAGTTQTAAAGESHVLAGTLLNPSLDLGPIREIILDSKNAYFSNLKILAIPGSGPLDDFVTVAPGTSTLIDAIGYAEAGAPGAGLQLPLQLVGQPGPPGLPGARTAISNNDIVYTNTVRPKPGVHPVDSFTYKVKDANGATATGTVYIIIDAPPQIRVVADAPAELDQTSWQIPHGTPGPLTGTVYVSDAEGDQVSLTPIDQLSIGKVTILQVSPYEFRYSYAPPTTYAYDPLLGVPTKLSTIVGDDQFSLVANDSFGATTGYAVRFSVQAGPPPAAGPEGPIAGTEPNNYVVPENNGVSYYATNPGDPYYVAELAVPGAVHFAAPGLLWNATDPNSSPLSPSHADSLSAVADPAHPPEHGTLQLSPDGSFTYTPIRDWTGIDRFGYFVSDGYQLSNADPRNPSSHVPYYAIIHVVSGEGQNPNRPVPVVLDDHYSLTLAPNESVQGRFPGSIGANDWSYGEAQVDNSSPFYPSMGVVVRPSNANGHVIRVSSDLKNFSVDYIYDSRGDSLYIGVVPNGQPVGPIEVGYRIFEIDEVSSSFLVPTQVTFTYAFVNQLGWLSNFASVIVKVFPPGPGQTVTVRDHAGNAVTLYAERGTTLSDVHFVSPLPENHPLHLGVPWLISFSVKLPSDYYEERSYETVVTITLPPGSPHFTSYDKYGPTPSDRRPHWYPFLYPAGPNGETGADLSIDPDTGVERIRLHLEDGFLGDNDLKSNGIIVDPGGPGFSANPGPNPVDRFGDSALPLKSGQPGLGLMRRPLASRGGH